MSEHTIFSKSMNVLVQQYFMQKNRKIMGWMSFLKMPLPNILNLLDKFETFYETEFYKIGVLELPAL